MEHTQHRGALARRRLTGEQRQRLHAIASAEEHDQVFQDIRLAHIQQALTDATAAGWLTQGEAESILERLERGADPHSLRRELRVSGVLLRRADNEQRHDVGDSNA